MYFTPSNQRLCIHWSGQLLQKRHQLAILILVLLSGFVPVLAQNAFRYQQYVQQIEQKWMQEEQRRFQDFAAQQQAQFEAFVSQEERAYQQFVKEVEAKWNQFLAPGRTQYVEYSQDKETRVVVPFGDEGKTAANIGDRVDSVEPEQESQIKPGKIRFETLVPADAVGQIGIATSKILDQAEQMLKPVREASTSFLDGLVQKVDGQNVSLDNVAQFFQIEVSLQISCILPKK